MGRWPVLPQGSQWVCGWVSISQACPGGCPGLHLSGLLPTTEPGCLVLGLGPGELLSGPLGTQLHLVGPWGWSRVQVPRVGILKAVLGLCDRPKGGNLSGFPPSLAVSMLSAFSPAAWLVGEIKSSHREGRKQRGSIAGEQGGPASPVLTCPHRGEGEAEARVARPCSHPQWGLVT